MRSIALYIEGGGDSEAGKAALRQGFDKLLATQKEEARARRMRWKTVLCGARSAAFDAFVNATIKKTSDITVLLVDAERSVVSAEPSQPTASERIEHLSKAPDHWDLSSVPPERVHLMIECMEAWIAADREQLAAFYGKNFHPSALPRRPLFDEVPQKDWGTALKAATRDSQKGSYSKLQHASEILKRVNPSLVAQRCASFRQFIEWLDAEIAEA